MGADWFATTAHGKNAKEAFHNAREDARYEHGHAGYTGTVAEKHSFIMIDGPTSLEEAYTFADDLCEQGDPRIDDKYGPAGCLQLDTPEDTFLFFGIASS